MPIRGHTTVAAPLGQTDESDVYATHEARRGKGGLVTGITSLAERDAIPPERRDAGMIVHVLEAQQYYSLSPDLITWQAVNFGAASNNLYVPTRAVTSDAVLGIEDYSVYVSAQDNAITVFLPSSAAIGNGRRYEITATDISFAITLQAPAGELISGDASYQFGSVYDSITIESFASNWFIK
ncbi:MAG: hypothetical protein PHP00_06860 [Thiotrichaceae bacterium]|nr:hypothetical protein [Thiotrichaceae bacterium]